MYLPQISEESAKIEDAFDKAMKRAEQSISNFHSQMQDQYNPCNTTRDCDWSILIFN